MRYPSRPIKLFQPTRRLSPRASNPSASLPSLRRDLHLLGELGGVRPTAAEGARIRVELFQEQPQALLVERWHVPQKIVCCRDEVLPLHSLLEPLHDIVAHRLVLGDL